MAARMQYDRRMSRVPFALAFAVAVAACGHASYPASMQHHLLNQPLPDIHARETINGGPLDASSLKGRVVVVKFFATYCQPCKETLPAAQHVHDNHDDVAFVGVSLDESRSAAEELVAKYKITFPVVYDAARIYQGKFRVNEMPRTFVTDKQGIVRWVGGEGQTEFDLEQAVRAAQ
jgi:thiol-disulfide isomerase/thioredoxin